MRAMMLVVLLVVAGCSAPTPLRSTDAAADDAERSDHDSPPMGDAVCLSNEQFDTLADFECPTVEVTCADAPVTVTCECPAAEPEAVNEADECPFRPTFAIAPTATVWDTTSEFSVLSFGVAAICRPLTAETLNLSLHRVEDGRAPEQDICTVFDCDAGMRLIEHVTGGDQVPLVGGISGAWMGGWLDVDGDGNYTIPIGEERNFILFGTLRADAPPGRYRFHLEDFALVDDVDKHYNFPGYPALGPEIVVLDPEPVMPPRFINVSNPVPLNPRGAQRVLEFRRCAGSQPLTMVELQFVLGEYSESTEGSAWRTRSPCEVLDCGTTSATWTIEDGSGATSMMPLAPRTDASVVLATPFDWEGTVIPSERCAYFSIETETRADTPTGRYSVSSQFFAEHIGGEEDVTLTAPLLRGGEIIVLE